MKHNKFLKTFICLCLLLCTVACTKSTKATSTTEKKSDIEPAEDIFDTSQFKDTHSDDGRSVVGISMPSKRLERWNRDGNYLKTNFTEKGYEVNISFADDLIDRQFHDIWDMIDAGADVLIITPIDCSSLGPALEKAKACNVPVIAYDRLLMNSDAVDYYVSFDNYMVGQMQGEFIKDNLDLLHPHKDVYNMEICSGDTLDNNARYFYSGMYDVLYPYIRSGTLNIPSSQMTYYETATSSWSTDLAAERYSGLLNSYYMEDDIELDAVACANDSTALGVTTAVEADYNKDNDVVITGQDCDNANLKNIIDGKQSMSIYKALPNQTIVALAVGEALIQGKKPDEDLIKNANWDFECNFNTKTYDNNSKVVKSFLLTPTVVTKDNYYETLVEPGYYTLGEDGYPVAVE